MIAAAGIILIGTGITVQESRSNVCQSMFWFGEAADCVSAWCAGKFLKTRRKKPKREAGAIGAIGCFDRVPIYLMIRYLDLPFTCTRSGRQSREGYQVQDGSSLRAVDVAGIQEVTRMSRWRILPTSSYVVGDDLLCAGHTVHVVLKPRINCLLAREQTIISCPVTSKDNSNQ